MRQLPIAESCLRNQDAIYEVLKSFLRSDDLVFEIGSGTGQHGVYIADRLPDIRWQLSDREECLAAMIAWAKVSEHKNVLKPEVLDVNSEQSSSSSELANLVFTANTLHFVSPATASNILISASNKLVQGGLLAIYGPFNDGENFTSEGNVRLDAWLKNRDPESGIKSMQWVEKEAASRGFSLAKTIAMPANNLILIYRKTIP